MKAFLKRLFLFLVPVLVIAAASEVLLRRIPNDYRYKSDYLDKNSDSVEILVLGNSHSYYGIRPELLGASAFNAAYVSQTIDYDYAILDKYRDHWKNLRCIIVTVSYSTLFKQLRATQEDWRVKNYALYYHVHPSGNFFDYSEIVNTKLNISFNRISDYYLRKKTPPHCSPLGWGMEYKAGIRNNLESTGKEAAKRHNSGNCSFYKENTALLDSILTFAGTHHISVLIYTPPAWKSYSDHLDPKRLQKIRTTIDLACSTHSGCRYVSFLTDTTFHSSDFFDGDHLNSDGACKLTGKIRELLPGSDQ